MASGLIVSSFFIPSQPLPFKGVRSASGRELCARIRAEILVRRNSSSTFTFGEFQLDSRVPELKKRGRTVRIPQQPIQILSLLIAAAGEVVTRRELRDAVWAQDTHV